MPRPRKYRPQPEDAGYYCPACGEEVHLSIDASAGEDQVLVEDCPVCCQPSVLRISVEEDGAIRIEAERE